jgi:predicted transcriptional regulator
MPANMRIVLPDELTARLDAIRGPATRTAYVMWIIEQALGDETPALDPVSVRPARKAAGGACKHQHAIKGFCRECGTGGH